MHSIPVLTKRGTFIINGTELKSKYIIETINELTKKQEIEGIDYIDNERMRLIGELLQNQLMRDMATLKHIICQCMSTQDVECMSPATIMSKAIATYHFLNIGKHIW